MSEEESEKSLLGGIGIFILGVTSMLYFALLGKILWDWFLVEKMFELTYWELLLGTLVVRFILMGSRVGSVEARMDSQVGKLTPLEKSMRIVSDAIGGTVVFGVFYIIKLIISYYS